MKYIVGLLFVMLVQGCSSVTKQKRGTTILDASQEDTLGGTGTSSADIRSMAQRMALEIAAIEWPKELGSVRIALTTIDNQTRFPINPNIIKDRLLADLLEYSMGTKLIFTENSSSADYFLSARMTALSKGSREGVSDYISYSFKLIDKAETVVWMKNYETKKQGSVGVMYQ